MNEVLVSAKDMQRAPVHVKAKYGNCFVFEADATHEFGEKPSLFNAWLHQVDGELYFSI